MTATETIWAVESCAITEAEALRRSGAETMVALYRMAILELAPQLRRPARADARRPAARAA
ncbi:hypothetical protein [Aureimonas leprariae]|uniref:Uncharacterized protein n=1 Tax=Plantimonas leprariae TaxID=2615207 RepID=A0A7V7PSZ6_9HYPH|nr:hypothetical protein [Aureimonas leprariae]KAB0682765.1 hypothetical protein F6X38_01400 [Aureimonas leprariae]